MGSLGLAWACLSLLELTWASAPSLPGRVHQFALACSDLLELARACESMWRLLALAWLLFGFLSHAWTRLGWLGLAWGCLGLLGLAFHCLGTGQQPQVYGANCLGVARLAWALLGSACACYGCFGFLQFSFSLPRGAFRPSAARSDTPLAQEGLSSLAALGRKAPLGKEKEN